MRANPRQRRPGPRQGRPSITAAVVGTAALLLGFSPHADAAKNATPAIALDWQTVKGQALSLLTAGNVLTIFGVDKDGKAWRRDGQSWNAVALPNKGKRRRRYGAGVPVQLRGISAGTDGTVWATTRTGTMLRRRKDGGWDQIPGKLVQVSVGSDKQVWGIDDGGQVFHRTGDGWRSIKGPKLEQIAAASDGTLWGVGPKGEVHRRKAKVQTWEKMPGQLLSVAVGKAGLVAGIGPGPRVWRWTDAGVWKEVHGIIGAASLALTPGGELWVSNKTGEVSRLSLIAHAAVADRAAEASATVGKRIAEARTKALAAAKSAGDAETMRVKADAEKQYAAYAQALAATLGNVGLYMPERPDSCGSRRRAYGVTRMTAGDCRRMGGRMNGNPPKHQWTGCHFDWCVAKPGRGYSATRPGGCGNSRAAYGIVNMPVANCRRMGGRMNGNPPNHQWTDCHLDWCRGGSPKIVAAGPGWCRTPVLAYGNVKMTARDCRTMGGNYNGEPEDGHWIDCHFDWCQYPATKVDADAWVRRLIDRNADRVRATSLMASPTLSYTDRNCERRCKDGKDKSPFRHLPRSFRKAKCRRKCRRKKPNPNALGVVFQQALKAGESQIRAEWNRRAASAGKRKEGEILGTVERQLVAQGLSLDPDRARAAVEQKVWNEARRKLGLPVVAPVKAPGPGGNLARGKPATQSSTSHGGAAARAVDGNTSGGWGHNSVTHTIRQPGAWWQVDLGSVRDITSIRLWNRTDCCSQRLSNFHVLVSEHPFSPNPRAALAAAGFKHHHRGRAGRTTNIKVNARGRYLRIQLAGSDFLSLAEVEVLGQ